MMGIKELVIISGKGGTGKSSLTASFAALAEDVVIADCDIDAANLHLILSPVVKETHDFYSGNEAVIRQDNCINCGECAIHCRFDAVQRLFTEDEWLLDNAKSHCETCVERKRSYLTRVNEMVQLTGGSARQAKYIIDPLLCEGCGVCVHFCPEHTIDFPSRLCGQWIISETRFGPMVHAQLGVAAENSGKLVSLVKKESRRIALEEGRSLVITDGPPGIGCPVIASISNADFVLIVAEPTVAGKHDLERVRALCEHFGIPAMLCVNKWDLNPEISTEIENYAVKAGVKVLGRIRYDNAFSFAQINAIPVIETGAPCVEDIKSVWKELAV